MSSKTSGRDGAKRKERGILNVKNIHKGNEVPLATKD